MQAGCQERLCTGWFPKNNSTGRVPYRCLSRAGSKIDYAIDVDVPDENIVKRLGGRRACVKCGATSHVVFAAPKTRAWIHAAKSLYCVMMTSRNYPEANVYHEQTQPLFIDYYTGRACLKIVTVPRTWMRYLVILLRSLANKNKRIRSNVSFNKNGARN